MHIQTGKGTGKPQSAGWAGLSGAARRAQFRRDDVECLVLANAVRSVFRIPNRPLGVLQALKEYVDLDGVQPDHHVSTVFERGRQCVRRSRQRGPQETCRLLDARRRGRGANDKGELAPGGGELTPGGRGRAPGRRADAGHRRGGRSSELVPWPEVEHQVGEPAPALAAAAEVEPPGRQLALAAAADVKPWASELGLRFQKFTSLRLCLADVGPRRERVACEGNVRNFNGMQRRPVSNASDPVGVSNPYGRRPLPDGLRHRRASRGGNAPWYEHEHGRPSGRLKPARDGHDR